MSVVVQIKSDVVGSSLSSSTSVTKIHIGSRNKREESIYQSFGFSTRKCRNCERKRVILGGDVKDTEYTCFQCENYFDRNKRIIGQLRKLHGNLRNTCGAILTLVVSLVVLFILLASVGEEMSHHM